LFGYPARDWAFPPLNQMARLYPLGLLAPASSRPPAPVAQAQSPQEELVREQVAKDLLLRSPLRIEADGSFRMNATVSDGTEAYLMVGSLSACQRAASAAAEQALAALEGARPVFALVLADLAWQMLFEAQPGADIAAVQAALGEGIPVAGGYTLGQIMPQAGAPPQFLNQHMLVVLFGETQAEKNR
jgi:hypothetical protein